MRQLIQKITEHEGFSELPYIDPLVARYPEENGIPTEDMIIIEKHFHKLKVTFGIGQTVISREAAQSAINIDLYSEYINPLLRAKPIVARLSESKQLALYDMAYNLGVNGLLQFKRMWLALENGHDEEAAQELLDSKYARQLPQRAMENAMLIRS